MDDRRDDWHHGVEENLASLNAGQRVWERDLHAIRKTLADIDNLLRGDPEKDTDGIVARLHSQENEVNLLKAILLKDRAGNKGIVGRVEDLESGERRSETHLKLWVALISLASAMTVAAISNLDRIEAFVNRRKIEQVSHKGSHSKAKHKREEPQQSDDEE